MLESPSIVVPRKQQQYTMLMRMGTKGFAPSGLEPSGIFKMTRALYVCLPPVELASALRHPRTDPNVMAELNDTALIRASDAGHVEVCEVLLADRFTAAIAAAPAVSCQVPLPPTMPAI